MDQPRLLMKRSSLSKHKILKDQCLILKAKNLSWVFYLFPYHPSIHQRIFSHIKNVAQPYEAELDLELDDERVHCLTELMVKEDPTSKPMLIWRE